MPEVDQHTLEWLTGLHVQYTYIQPQWDTRLVFSHILTEGLRLRPDVRALGYFGSKHAGVILDVLVVRGLGLDLVGGVC